MTHDLWLGPSLRQVMAVSCDEDLLAQQHDEHVVVALPEEIDITNSPASAKRWQRPSAGTRPWLSPT